MIITGWWWLLITFVIAIPISLFIHLHADQGGKHCLDFGDLWYLYVIPITILVFSIILGLAMGMLGLSLSL